MGVLSRKTPRVHIKVRLQCVLSGNQVIREATIYSFKWEQPIW